MKYILEYEYNVKYDQYDVETIYKSYRYFTISHSNENPLFRKYQKFRYDGCKMHSIILFKYGIHWGESYEWIDSDYPMFAMLDEEPH